METLTTWHLCKRISRCSRNGDTHTWNKQKASERLQRAVGRVDISDNRSETQRGGSCCMARTYPCWPSGLLPAGLSSVPAEVAGGPPRTNTSAGTTMDKNPLQWVRHFAELSPCQAILWSACTDNLQRLQVLRCAHVIVLAHLLLYLFGNTWHEYDHYQWVILQ